MKFKEGVKINGIKPEMVVALMIVNEVIPSVTITSVVDGRHTRTSLHYVGYAIDIRTRDLIADEIAVYAGAIRDKLTDEFDVIVESNHIHIEFQPKYSPTD